MKIRIIIILALTVFLAGCAIRPTFQVKVDSISGPDASIKTKYLLLPGLKDADVNDLQFKEYATYVDRALTYKGFIKANDFQDANIVIFIVYGIGDPQTQQYSYALPMWGQTGVSSSTTYGTLSTYGRYGTYQGTTTYTPSYGITGYIPMVGAYTTYFRFLILDAINLDEYKSSQKILQLWKTTVTSIGSSGDLRKVFPYLVAACRPYLGTNTGQKVEIMLAEDDNTVIEIRGLSKQNK
jgi:hypothetical protein